MISTLIFLAWVLINIIFLFNFNLAAGYLVIVNLAFAIASYIADPIPANYD